MADADNRGRSDVVLDVARVVALEQAIAASGTSLRELMTRAGGAVAAAVRRACACPAKVVVLAGSGNNGGDGWVAADALAADGYDVVLLSMKRLDDIAAQPARAVAQEIAVRASDVAGGGNLRIVFAPSEREVAEALVGAGVAVDALLGTGFSGESLRDPVASWVAALVRAREEHGLHVIAADVPSGLSAQTGDAAVPCVRADETVTMLALKPGLLTPHAEAYVGTVICDSLGIDIAHDFPAFA